MPVIISSIIAEVQRANPGESLAYLIGAMRDGTFNRLHKTIRIAQADIRWLKVLQSVIRRIGSRSWIYREGIRRVWVIESTCRLHALGLAAPWEAAAFARGYFDAEGGVPHETRGRFYIQITQKDRNDLGRVREVLESLGVRCGEASQPEHPRRSGLELPLYARDMRRYLTFNRHADDYTLMAPFGGEPTRGFAWPGRQSAGPRLVAARDLGLSP